MNGEFDKDIQELKNGYSPEMKEAINHTKSNSILKSKVTWMINITDIIFPGG